MKLIFACFIFLQLLPGFSQAQSTLDSLRKQLSIASPDSNKVKLLIKIGAQYENSDLEAAKAYYIQAGELSKHINYLNGVFAYYSSYTEALNQQGRFDSMLIVNLESVALSKKIGDSLQQALMLMNTGNAYRQITDYENAIRTYEEGKAIFARIGNTTYEGEVSDVLQNLFTSMRQYRKAINHGLDAIQKLNQSGSAKSLSYAYNNLALNYIYIRSYDSAKYYLEKSSAYASDAGSSVMVITNALNIAYIFLRQEQYDSSRPYVEKALQLSRENNMREYEALSLWGLSMYHLGKKELTTAKLYGDSVLKLANQYNFRDQKQKVLTTLSQVAFAMNDISLGKYYADQQQDLSDSLLNESITNNTINIEKKYETEKKESRIRLQESQLKQKNTLNYFLIAGATLLMIILLLTYRNYRSRQQLQEQRISELEKEKQLSATQSLLRGQEEERSRVAKELHDGLGGLLSGVKLQLGAMKGSLVLSNENATGFDRALKKLDESISEMRRVAHDMMPEALVNLGLQQAVYDYCEHLSYKQAFTINCEMHGWEKRLDNAIENVLYRIVQELLNNAVKHSGASAIIMQMIRHDDGQVSITVEDNGKGFDLKGTDLSRSAGMRNVQSRVNYLNGVMDVKSEVGGGTSVYIECVVG